MTTSEYKTLGECCPIFNVEKWDDKTHHWNHKHFIKSSMPTLFHIPFPPIIGNKIEKMMKMAETSNAVDDDMSNMLLLFRDPGPFKSEMYLSVNTTVPAANNVDLNGEHYSRVYEGSYNAVPKFMKELDKELASKGKKARKYYVHYAYCPKCAKEAGTNYLVLFAELENPSLN